jgi:hypothetical protein
MSASIQAYSRLLLPNFSGQLLALLLTVFLTVFLSAGAIAGGHWPIASGAFASLFIVLFLPKLREGFSCAVQPIPVRRKRENFHQSKMFRTVMRWISKWLEQTCTNQRRKIVCAEAK